MGNCKDCEHWETDMDKSTELFLADYHGKDVSNLGACESDSKLMKPSYDGGMRGELLTHADFGCNQFEARNK